MEGRREGRREVGFLARQGKGIGRQSRGEWGVVEPGHWHALPCIEARGVRLVGEHQRGIDEVVKPLERPAHAGRPIHRADVEREPVGDLVEQFERSEEHTSELQSLMRISYAVFCLIKKNMILLLIYVLQLMRYML